MIRNRIVLFLICSGLSMSSMGNSDYSMLPKDHTWYVTNYSDLPINVEYFAATVDYKHRKIKCKIDRRHPLKSSIVVNNETNTLINSAPIICMRLAGTSRMAHWNASNSNLFYPNTKCPSEVGNFCPIKPH